MASTSGDKETSVSFDVDIDAVAGWLGSYGGEDSSDGISCGLFAGEVGVPRILELFRREGLTRTFGPRPSHRARVCHKGHSETGRVPGRTS